MRLRILILFGVVGLSSPAPAADVFVTAGQLHSNPFVDYDPTATGDLVLRRGESTELVVWVTPASADEIIDRVSLDLLADPTGVVDATSSEVYDVVPGPFGPRWDLGVENGDPNPATPAGLLVVGMLGAADQGMGLDIEKDRNIQFTTFVLPPDVSVDGNFPVAEVTIAALRRGRATITPAPNGADAITARGLGAVDATYAGITIIVVPEPAAISLLSAAALGFCVRRLV